MHCSERPTCRPMELLHCKPVLEDSPCPFPSFGCPLGFCAASCQATRFSGQKLAYAALASPVLLGVCGGAVEPAAKLVGAVPHFPGELLEHCRTLAEAQLAPSGRRQAHDRSTWQRPSVVKDMYQGPVSLLEQAYLDSGSLGTQTVMLAMLDNTSRVHGEVRPFIAVLSAGDACGRFLLLRRSPGTSGRLAPVYCTEARDRGSHPAGEIRVYAKADESKFDSSNEGNINSSVKCLSAQEGDIVVLGSCLVFEALTTAGLTEVCNEATHGWSRPFRVYDPDDSDEEDCMHQFNDKNTTVVLHELSQRIAAMARTRARLLLLPGLGDDVAVVVAGVMPWDTTVAVHAPAVVASRGGA